MTLRVGSLPEGVRTVESVVELGHSENGGKAPRFEANPAINMAYAAHLASQPNYKRSTSELSIGSGLAKGLKGDLAQQGPGNGIA